MFVYDISKLVLKKSCKTIISFGFCDFVLEDFFLSLHKDIFFQKIDKLLAFFKFIIDEFILYECTKSPRVLLYRQLSSVDSLGGCG